MAKILLSLLLISSIAFAQSQTEECISITGTVKYTPIEGGFFLIVADDGKRYDPINLDIELQKDGLRLKVKAKVRDDLVSYHMSGTLIEIMEIERMPEATE